jgi:prepilin-type N-terminal cleavage/methylation domain-containing protein
MNIQKGMSLLETLITLSIASIMLSFFHVSKGHLSNLQAKKLCNKIESSLYTIRYIAEMENDKTILRVDKDNHILGSSSKRIILKESLSNKIINIHSANSTLESVIFYPKNTASRSLIEVRDQDKSYCAISISLRGRIKKVFYV